VVFRGVSTKFCWSSVGFWQVLVISRWVLTSWLEKQISFGADGGKFVIEI
jgi:hypothetical protein